MSSSQKLKRVLGGMLRGGGGVEVQATVVEVVERGGRSCRGEMLAAGVPVCFCLLILYDAIRKAVRASERSPRSTRSTVYSGERN